MNEPAHHAETMREAYQTYLQGRGGLPAKSVASRLQPDSAGESTLAGMRGPYLQALPIANWSHQDWSTFAGSQSLHPNIKRAFHQEGFRRLYDFQERSVERILAGDDTVISAATGRGKTEAWLIPILDQIVKSKTTTEQSGRTSTKALLMYPTKALAQDQFKRLVQILYRVNRNLREKEWVTVGIYDGDTPRHKHESNAQGYLNRTFQHFGCPGANDDLDKCQSCGQGVFVETSSSGFRLRPDKPRCEDDRPHEVPLDFVHLTRTELIENGADIILTNPDTVNYRLFNINGETEREAFIYEPEFLVFDEVHTYDGLLGSYTATLVKRLRRLRERRDSDPLQVIGSSATVANDEELFRQVSGASEVTSVREDPRSLDSYDVQVPEALYEDIVDSESIVDAGRSDSEPPSQFGDVDVQIENARHLDNDRLEDQVADELFNYYTADSTDDPVIQTFQTLYMDLSSEPRTPKEFVTDTAERFDLTREQASRVVENFQTVGQFAGLLESRHHLFSWPLDGFYACVSCEAVYRSPQDECGVCSGEFVTRATYCNNCGEEHLVADACSNCDRLIPHVHTEEGLIGDEEFQPCPFCGTHEDTGPLMHRVTFSPFVRCADCGHAEPRSMTDSCDRCGTQGVPTDKGTFVCRNPSCGHTWELTRSCSSCSGSDLQAVGLNGSIECSDCGEPYSAAEVPTDCSCGNRVTNTRYVPWVCADGDCEAVHFEQSSPERCSCGSTEFVKRGLYEVSTVHTCSSCDTEHLDGGGCDCPDPSYRTTQEPYRRYRTWNGERHVRSPLGIPQAIPCEHSLHSTVVGDPYTELMRSPTNAAVTPSQYLLRDIASEEGLSDSKLLAFSDSHRDMKEIDRAFTEPEVDTALDQLVLAGLELALAGRQSANLGSTDLATLTIGASTNEQPPEEADSIWVDLERVAEHGYELLSALEQELGDGDVRDQQGVDLASTIFSTEYLSDPESAVKDKLRRRAVRHVGERPSTGVSLETDGLVDVRLSPSVRDKLVPEEEAVIAALVDAGDSAALTDIVGEEDDERRRIIDLLVSKGVLEFRNDDRVAFDPTVLELTLPQWGSVQYNPSGDEYYSQRQHEYQSPTGVVRAEDSVLDRAERIHPRFTERAFTATRSRVALLLSELYFGATPKMRRREIEHLFREGTYPHFLSSGPTMEMGVDIGSLDTLLLYGTPPNMNAYLQRIGRAGRRSGSALVHSVSQRNPIDYYYYDEPIELIDADKQPVPLNEHNERVLRVSLAWGVLDYLAAEFVVPWETTQNSVKGGESVQRRSEVSEERRDEVAKFTKVLSRNVSQLELGTDKSRLRPVEITITDHEREIREYLESMLSYAYCIGCHRHFDESKAGTECPECDSDRPLVGALTEHGHLVDDAVDAARRVFVNGYRTYADKLRERIREYASRRDEIESRLEAATAEEEPRLERQQQQFENRRRVLEEYLEQLSGKSYLTVLKDAFAEYAFSLRTVSDSVGIEVVDETGKPEPIGDDRSGRSSRLAIGELHPGAAYLHERRPFVVSQVFIDDKGSADLRETIETHAETAVEDIDGLAEDFVCQECGSTADSPDTDCSCGATAWQQRRLYALESVEATLDTESLPNELDRARQIYERSGERVQNTYAHRETEILDFDSKQQFELQTADGTPVGTLAFGEYEILEFTESYRTKYQSGAVDDEATTFELCGESDCTGIMYEDENDVRRCSVNADHVVDTGGSEATYARLGYSYSTEGVRVSLSEGERHADHTLIHGLRLALQKLSGVTIRDLNEYIGTGYADVFDSLEGGAAVSRLLIEEEDGAFENFQSAMDLISTQFSCDCSDGCPRCLYQYGCTHRNRPHSFERDDVLDLVENGLRLHRISGDTTEEA